MSTTNSKIVSRFLTPTGFAVVGITGAAWYATFATTDSLMPLIGSPITLGPLQLLLFFALITTMMVAMMLPAALPMIVTYHGLTRLKDDSTTPRADRIGTALFTAPYFLVWGGFGLLSLLGLIALGLMKPLNGLAALAPAIILATAGLYQITHLKEACLLQCQSPVSFVMSHWREGRSGAVRMGLAHAFYCVGCCWLFMMVLFVTGAMSLLWMGGISVIIFVEKVGFKRLFVSRVLGVGLIVLGVISSFRVLLPS